MSRSTLILIVALFACHLASAADAPGYDPNKLPVGSVWEGTFESEKGGKNIVSDALTIKISKREGNKFEGVWHQHNKADKKEPQYEMQGTIAPNNRVTIELIKQIGGKGRDDKVGNMKITGQLANDKLEGTGFIPDTKISMTWNAKLKKD